MNPSNLISQTQIHILKEKMTVWSPNTVSKNIKSKYESNSLIHSQDLPISQVPTKNLLFF